MTIANVVNENQCVWVEYNGIPYPAELVGYDNITNIAVVRLSRPFDSNIPFLHVGASPELPQPSVMLIALTCKMGWDPGPSMGMVTGWHTAFGENLFPTTYLRSNIPSDGGEEGSPVFDLSGQFIGVMMFSIESIKNSFIIPARAVMRIRDELIFSGKVSYAYLGIEIDREALITPGSLLTIGRVIEGGPAYEAGLKSGDKILEFNNTTVNHFKDFRDTTFFATPGQLLPVKVQRGDKELKLTVRLQEQPVSLCSESPKSIEQNQKTPFVQPSSSTSQDVPKDINAIIQKGDRWRNYVKAE